MAEIGDYLVTPTGSWFGRAIRWFTSSTVNHAAVYIGNGRIIEAQPHGARCVSMHTYPHAIWSHMKLTPSQRIRIATEAVALLRTPYNFLDIAAQAVVRLFNWHAPKWAIDRVSRPDRLQCAQLVDLCYSRGGVILFPDGRPMGLVAPSDLLNLIEADK